MAATVAEACTFDQWQKDVFFTAAEAVQESADTMESACRMWTRESAKGLESEGLDDIRRELQTALGTTKWQLEEFERAASLSYRSCSSGDGRIGRHGQFVAAIQNQITRVENSLCDSTVEERKQPLRWVQLDEEERDDLAAFLSAGPELSDKYRNTFDTNYVAELEEKDLSVTQGKTVPKHLRTWSSPDFGSWKTVTADKEGKQEESSRKTLETRTVEPRCVSSFSGLPKNARKPAESKRSRNSFWKGKSVEHLHLKSGISSYLDWKKKLPLLAKGRNGYSSEDIETSRVERSRGRIGRLKGQYRTEFSSSSRRITLLLMLSVFLLVSFVFYSN